MKQKRRSSATEGRQANAATSRAKGNAGARRGRPRRAKAANKAKTKAIAQTAVKTTSKPRSSKRNGKKPSPVATSAETALQDKKTQAPRPSTPTTSPARVSTGSQAATASSPKGLPSPSLLRALSSPKAPTSSPRTPSRIRETRSAGSKWSPIEVEALRQSQRETTPTDKYFWDQVASQVSKDCGTSRTAHACLKKYHELCISNGRKPPSIKQEKTRREPKALTFSLEDLTFGTNKRKRVLRSMVKKVEENYTDDYFAESSRHDDLGASFSFSDDDSFELEGPLIELSSSAPSSAPSSPEILRQVDRDEMDGYINQITKKIGKGRRARRKETEQCEEDDGQTQERKQNRGSKKDTAEKASERDNGIKHEAEEQPLPWARDIELDDQDDEVSLSEDDDEDL